MDSAFENHDLIILLPVVKPSETEDEVTNEHKFFGFDGWESQNGNIHINMDGFSCSPVRYLNHTPCPKLCAGISYIIVYVPIFCKNVEINNIT